MDCRRGKTNARQEAAYRDADVVEIVDCVLANPDASLLKLARESVLFRQTPDNRTLDGLIGIARVTAELRDIGRRIAAAGLRIAVDGSDREFRERKRGAVLERLTYELVRRRDGRAMREQQVRLLARRWTTRPAGPSGEWSKPKDTILADGHRAFEVYEAKFAANLDQDDLNELADIAISAMSEGTSPFAVLTTMESDRSLFTRLRLLEPRGTLYYAADENLLELRNTGPALTV